AAAVEAARVVLRAIDWCELRLIERPENLGLGRNIVAGVTEIAACHDAFIVWEDDLIRVPGPYAWVIAALRHYATDERVMSGTARAPVQQPAVASRLPEGLAFALATRAPQARGAMKRDATGLRAWLPRRWRKWVRRLVRPALYEGDYASWAEAASASRGYADP